METTYTGIMVKVYVDDTHFYHVLPKEVFDDLNNRGYSRKKCKEEFNISNNLWNKSNMYYYGHDPEKRGQNRTSKIKTYNSHNRYTMWEGSLIKLETHFPGVTLLFKENLKDNPEQIMDQLEEMSDLFYEVKIFIKDTKKYIRQACIRKGVPYKKMVANSAEYKIKRILISLGYTPDIQFYLDKHWYDFRIGKTLIKYDGIFHSVKKDSIKNQIAKSNGFNLIRISKSEIDDLLELKRKLKKCLRQAK